MQVEKISRFLCKTNLMQWLQEQELIFLEHTFSVIKSNEETFVLNGQQQDDKPVLIDIGGTTLLYTLEGSGRNLVKKLRGQGPIKNSIQIYVRSCRFFHLIHHRDCICMKMIGLFCCLIKFLITESYFKLILNFILNFIEYMLEHIL